MYKYFTNNNTLAVIIRKALISVLIGAFLFNDIAYAADLHNLAPKAGTTLAEFKERFGEGYERLRE